MTKYQDDPPPYSSIGNETTPLLCQPTQVIEEDTRRPHKWRGPTHSLLPSCILVTSIIGILYLFSIFLSPAQKTAPEPKVPARIAIIGGGPAGIATAFTLSQLVSASKDVKTNITIFDSSPRFGGRLTSPIVVADSQPHLRLHAQDVGSGALLSSNRIFKEKASRYLGESIENQGDEAVSSVGFWNGKDMLSKATRPDDKTSWSQYLSQVFRYGASIWRAKNLPTGIMERFMKRLHNGGEVNGIDDFLSEESVANAVGLSAAERLKLNGISQTYIEEVISPQAKRQSGLDIAEMSDLALSMALEREFQGFDSASIAGRFETVLERFVNSSKAELRLNTEITGLKRETVEEEDKESWILEIHQKGGSELAYEVFDQVILAAPWNTSFLNEENTSKEEQEAEQIHYRAAYITFLLSTDKLTFFHANITTPIPSQLLFVASPDLPEHLRGVHEVTLLRQLFRVDPETEEIQAETLYRVFSTHSILNSTLASQSADDGVISWSFEQEIRHAYPLLYPRNEGFGKFKTAPGLWHTNVVEAIGSSVDLSWVAGEKVAALVMQDIMAKKKR